MKTVRRRDQHRRPAPPFTTSTLQQEASRRFGYTARRTMALAQQLYEGIELRGSGRVGLITYMRTDSTNLADVAVREIRGYIGQRFGGDFLPPQPRVYKARKGAQEAHEAIRPTSVERDARTRRSCAASTNDQRRLYTLIWQRAVACQMADAVLDSVSVDIDADAATAATSTSCALRPAPCASPATASSTKRRATSADDDDEPSSSRRRCRS